MKADKEQRVCKYFNSGYCKFKGDCKYTHPKVNCAQIECKNKRCHKRHPKKCRYGDNCRRKSSCLYKHDLPSTPKPQSQEVGLSEVVKLKLEVEKLKEENKQKLHDIKVLTDENSGLKAHVRCLEATISTLSEENKETQVLLSKIEKELKDNLKKSAEEKKGKDKTIIELKEKLKQKEDKNKQQNMKLAKTEQESVAKDNEIKSLKQKNQTINQKETKGTGNCCTKRVHAFINTLIPCEFCESLWQNEDAVKTHEQLCGDHYGSA